MKFSEKIMKIRKENGLSQEEFGNKINISRQAVSKWESDQSQPEIEKVKEISKVFGISIEYLLNDELENDNAKIEYKANKKKFLKILLKVIITIIIIYLIYSVYKFIILFKVYNNILKISDNEIYTGTITSKYSDKVTNDISRAEKNIFCGKDLYICKSYMEFSDTQGNNLINREIVYINKEKELAFNLKYDTKKQKYIYNKKDINQMIENNEITRLSRKDIYLQEFLESNIFLDTPIFIQILKVSINPTIFVTNGYMKYFYKDGFKIVEFNDKGDVYDGIYKTYTFNNEIEASAVFDLNVVYDYNVSYYNESSEMIEYNWLKDIETIENFAEVCGIEVISEE